jgi:hypothetical protein
LQLSKASGSTCVCNVKSRCLTPRLCLRVEVSNNRAKPDRHAKTPKGEETQPRPRKPRPGTSSRVTAQHARIRHTTRGAQPFPNALTSIHWSTSWFFIKSSGPARGVRWPAVRVAAAIAGHADPRNRRLWWFKLFGRSRARVGDTNCPLCHGAWRCPSRGAPAWHGGKQRPCAGGARRRSSGVLCHRLIITDGFHGQALRTA